MPGNDVPRGLVYVSDAMPGIGRVRRGDAFAYRDAGGRRIRDEAELARIRRLAIPPAYSAVWICPLAHGHLQATGRDARGRKQYRYHRDWSRARDEDKFDRLEAFGRALPRVRARVALDLEACAHDGPARRLVLATVVKLLDATCVRVGNDEYARENGSFGLTTLRNRHAAVAGGTLKLAFRGKSGVQHELAVDDPRLAAVVRRCQQLPGQDLFRYRSEDGAVRAIDSADVNQYLSEAAGDRYTAKDFRTWHASVQAFELMRKASDVPPTKALIKQAVAEVAARLRNTASVCRKSYIHPAVLGPAALATPAGPARRIAGLAASEQRLLAYLAALPSLEQALAASLGAHAPAATRAPPARPERCPA